MQKLVIIIEQSALFASWLFKQIITMVVTWN